MTEDLPSGPTRTLHEIVEDDLGEPGHGATTSAASCKRLQRIDKDLSGEAREALAAYVPDGDLARFARDLPRALSEDFTGTMKRLRDGEFQDALLRLPAPRPHLRPRHRVRGHGVVGADAARQRRQGLQARGLPGRLLALRPGERGPGSTAIRILLDRPRDWSATALSELKQKLAATRQRFTVDNLQRAHEMRHRKALVDIISMVKHAAREESPLLTSAERVARAFQKVTQGQTFTPDQQAWLDRIRTVMQANLAHRQGRLRQPARPRRGPAAGAPQEEPSAPTASKTSSTT